jgi:uncharacterized membrane protein
MNNYPQMERAVMLALMGIYVGMGLVMLILAVPLIQKRIPPNHIYGFRVKRTLENPDIWYPVNVYAGKTLLAYGIVIVISALVFYPLSLTEDEYANVMTVVILGALVLMVGADFLYLNRLTKS